MEQVQRTSVHSKLIHHHHSLTFIHRHIFRCPYPGCNKYHLLLYIQILRIERSIGEATSMCIWELTMPIEHVISNVLSQTATKLSMTCNTWNSISKLIIAKVLYDLHAHSNFDLRPRIIHVLMKDAIRSILPKVDYNCTSNHITM